MQSKKLIITIILISLLIIPIISAYTWGGGSWGYFSPLDYLESPIVLFVILFLIFFAIIFYSLNKAMKNPAVSAVIGFALSLFISLAISRRGLLWNFGGGGLDSWILLIAALIGIGFLIKFASDSFGRIGTLITIVLLWILIFNFSSYQLLPYQLSGGGFETFYNFLGSPLGLILLILLSFFLSGKGPKTNIEELTGFLGRKSR